MRETRLGPVAAAITAAVSLLLGGCGSGDTDSSGDGGADGATSTSRGAGSDGEDEGRPDDGGPGGGSADTGGSGGPGGGGQKADLSPYLGPWAAGMKSDAGKPMILIFNKDGTVSLAAENLACQGTLKAASKPAELDMECRDEGDPYTAGKITELNGESLTVTWDSGETSEFLKGAAPAGPPGE